MELQLDSAIAILERTPAVLRTMLEDLGDDWTRADEGPETFSPFDVVGHLIHGEKTDWMVRVRRILEHGDGLPFEPFDRFAQLEASRGKSLGDLLDELETLREANLAELRKLRLAEDDFDRPGLHPELGAVTLGQLLATWVVHDLVHIAQVARVMAKQLGGEVGAWREYLPVLGDRD